jgi:hypothetical protein
MQVRPDQPEDALPLEEGGAIRGIGAPTYQKVTIEQQRKRGKYSEKCEIRQANRQGVKRCIPRVEDARSRSVLRPNQRPHDP